MTQFEIFEGSPGLQLDEVVHILIPGRGRTLDVDNPTGVGLTDSGLARADHAADFYMERELGARDGVIVPAGYKTPAEKMGTLWSPADNTSEIYTGMPEAELIRLRLLSRGIAGTAIRAERSSIDTVTNFSLAQGYFPDSRPVAIFAQKEHLARMLEVIAPRTLRREYLGVIVPEAEQRDSDSRIAQAFSRIALVGITPETPDSEKILMQRVTRMWRGVNLIQRIVRR